MSGTATMFARADTSAYPVARVNGVEVTGKLAIRVGVYASGRTMHIRSEAL